MEASETQEAPAKASHEITVGPTQAFDAKGVVRTVWALKCSCGHKGQAIDQSGIGREARLHTLELQLLEMGALIGTLFAALEGMAGQLAAAGIVPPDAPMPEPPTEPAG